MELLWNKEHPGLWYSTLLLRKSLTINLTEYLNVICSYTLVWQTRFLTTVEIPDYENKMLYEISLLTNIWIANSFKTAFLGLNCRDLDSDGYGSNFFQSPSYSITVNLYRHTFNIQHSPLRRSWWLVYTSLFRRYWYVILGTPRSKLLQ